MRLMFVHWVVEDRGSAQDMYHYAETAKDLGHEVASTDAHQVGRRSITRWI